MYSIEDIQENIIETLESAFVQPVVEQAVPDSHTVLRNDKGQIEPYLAIQFGDLQAGRTRSMAGPHGDDYGIPIYVQTVASTPKVARRLANKVVRVLLGTSYEWSGSIRKRPGGGMWPIVTSDGATEAYQFPASFTVLAQYHYEPDETP